MWLCAIIYSFSWFNLFNLSLLLIHWWYYSSSVFCGDSRKWWWTKMKVVEGTDTSSSFSYYLFSVQQQSAHLNLTNGCALVCTFGHLYCSSIFICVFVFWQTTNTQTYTSAAAAGRHFCFLVGYFSLIFPLPPDGQHVLGRFGAFKFVIFSRRRGKQEEKRKRRIT